MANKHISAELDRTSAWPSIQLGDVAQFVNGDRGENYPKQTDYVDNGIPFIGAGDLVDGRVSTASCTRISDVAFERLRGGKIQLRDLLFCLRGSLGKVARVTGIEPSAIASSLVIIRPTPRIDERYLFYVLSGPLGKQFTVSLNNGSVQPNISARSLQESTVPLPPLTEQRTIAHILGSLDDKIELNRKTNATLESMARALFRSWFVDFDPVRSNAEGRPQSGRDADIATLFPSELVDAPQGPIPAGWRFGAISEFVDLQRGNTYKSALKNLPGPVLLGLGSIQRNGGFRDDKLATYGGDSPEKLLVYPGDLFVSLKDVTQSADLLGAVARVPKHISKGRLTQDTVKLQVAETSGMRDVLYLTLLTNEYREYCRQHATGTTNLGLSRDDFLSYPIVVAPEPVLTIFNAAVRSISLRAETSLGESRALANLRDELMPRLLSGELSVRTAEAEIEAA